jgi:hypothetical protein
MLISKISLILLLANNYYQILQKQCREPKPSTQSGQSQSASTLISPTVTSGPPSCWITRVCRYPRREMLMARPVIKPGLPACMTDALYSELLITPVPMHEETVTDDP